VSLGSQEVGDALAVVSHLMLVLGDFNTHSQSWGYHSEDRSVCAVQSLFDGFNLVNLNDRTLTRIAASPQRSSVLCTVGLDLRDYE
jgi:hypothetical protein